MNTIVTISNRNNDGVGGIHLYYISFYLESHRFRTKHALIYSPSEREERMIRTTYRMTRNSQERTNIMRTECTSPRALQRCHRGSFRNSFSQSAVQIL